MSQIQIILPDDTTKKLKILATKADRSLKKFIPLYLNHIIDLNIIDVDERTGAFTSPTQSSNQSSSAQAITLDQLKEAGVKDFKFEKPQTELTPEEQEMQRLKLANQQNKILEQREKKWFKRAQEVMSDYWTDERCQYFAHKYIYGDAIYQRYPDDPNGTKPEPDDSRLEDILKYYLEEEREEENTVDTSELWDGYYDTLNELIRDPAPNDYYDRITKYCLKNKMYQELQDILAHPSADNLKYNHSMTVYAALDIPATHDLSDAEWREIAAYME